MKKIFLIAFVSVFMMTGTVYANTDSLPSAGITPDSPFYFLDRLGENIEEFFTFNPEAKAKLQIEFAGERISEIREMVKNDGIGSKGIQTAKKLLLANVAQATDIIKKEKTNGKDVTKLVKNIDDAFNAQEKLLTKTFQDARSKLEKDRLALKQNLTNTDITKNASGDNLKKSNSIDSTVIDAQLKLLDKDMGDLNGMQSDFNSLFNDGRNKIKKEVSINENKIKEDGKLNIKKVDKEDNSVGDSGEVEVENGDNSKTSSENEVENMDRNENNKEDQMDSENDHGDLGGVNSVGGMNNRDQEGE